VSGKVKHRTIFNVGSLEQYTENERKLLVNRIEEILRGNISLFVSTVRPKIEKDARYFADLIIKQGGSRAVALPSDDKSSATTGVDYAEVDLNSLENRDVQEIGAEWIVKQTMDTFGVGELLSNLGMSQRDITLAYMQWISRTVNPASELATEGWLKRNTGLCELMGVPRTKINRHHLYYISKKLYTYKTHIENHFTEKTRELCNVNDTIILYDLTNTYFEGRMLQSDKARFNKKSKEKRTDCKCIVLALVTDNHGFIRYSKIYRGNMADCKTLGTTIADLEHTTVSSSKGKPTVVMDAGIATEDNLQMLRSQSYHYVCISRSALKEYSVYPGAPYTILDKDNHRIEVKQVKQVKQDKNSDSYLYVKSPAKQKKEHSIDEKLSTRFEEGLEAITESLSKKRGIKKIEKVYERIGRLKSNYPRVAHTYTITTKQAEGKVYEISWKRAAKKTTTSPGIYFIRTSYTTTETDEQTIWNIYNCIREIESSFRCLKTELSIRPNYHQKDENIEAHINCGLLAYQIVSIIRYQLKRAGIRDSWETLLNKMNTQKVMTTSCVDKHNKKVHIRNCSVPNAELKEIQDILKLKPVPFYRKKVVVPQ
jgi:transposase